MNREKFIEMSYLYILNELTPTEKEDFEKILESDEEYKTEFGEIKIFYSLIDSGRQGQNDERVLAESRMKLMRNIRIEQEKESLWGNIKNLFYSYFVRNYRMALSGAVTAAFGIFIGYLIFAPSGKSPSSAQYGEISAAGILTRNDVDISNVRLPDSIPANGEIEINFEAVKPLSIKGNVNDPMVRKLLALVLTSESNPGERLRSVSAIAGSGSSSSISDPKIKQALLSALKNDSNPAVRREALTALSKMNPDADTRDAFLSVLAHDNNAGLRVAAINALSELKEKGITFDSPAKEILLNKSETDKNSFVRLQAASILND